MEKSGAMEHKSGNISEMRKDIEERLLWRAYRKSPVESQHVSALAEDSMLGRKDSLAANSRSTAHNSRIPKLFRR